MKWQTSDWHTMLESGQWVTPGDCNNLRALLGNQVVCLASGSPRRREILAQCGLHPITLEQSLYEPPPRGPDWRAWVRSWSIKKARAGSKGVQSGVVISADTIVVLGKRGLGKPKNQAHAQSILRSLSGRTHQVYSGVAVIHMESSRIAAGSAVSQVRFRRLTGADITRYVKTDEPSDKAGAYAIQGGGEQFVEAITGPLDNIIGLPVGCLVRLLRRVLS